MDHAQAREHVLTAFQAVFGRPAPVSAAQCVQAVGFIETSYGAGWKGAGAGSLNLGAIQRGKPPCNLQTSFLYTDTHPNDDGTSSTYQACFAKYASADKAFEDLIRVVYINNVDLSSRRNRARVLAAAERGDVYGVSEELYRSGYYEGFGPRVADRIQNHFVAMTSALAKIAAALNEPMPNGEAAPPPTIRFGSAGTILGPYVQAWQRILGVVADGIFGKMTLAATRIWQRDHGLVDDGVVGPLTWARANEV